MIKKSLFSLILFFSVGAFATGGAQSANITSVSASVAGVASGVHAQQNFARCSWLNFAPCIEGFMAIKQLIDMFKTARSSRGVALDLGNGDYGQFGFDPVDAGFCLDPNSGCTQDAIDQSLSTFSDAFTSGEGLEDALNEYEKNALNQLNAAAEKAGMTVDLEKGTVTDRNGNVSNLSDSSPTLSQNLSASASEKLSGLKSALGSGSSQRALASAGGASSGKAKALTTSLGSGLLSGSFNSTKNKKKKKKDLKGKFLAGLSDKDALKGGVGFAGDDIFNMIQRRYTKKINSKEFID